MQKLSGYGDNSTRKKCGLLVAARIVPVQSEVLSVQCAGLSLNQSQAMWRVCYVQYL